MLDLVLPLWARLAIVAALVVAAAVTGFVKGIEWQQGRQAQAVVADAIKTVEHTRTVIQKDNTALAASQLENDQLRSDNERLQKEVAAHAASIPDRPECRFAPERVRTVRAAWGVGADPAAGQGRLRGPEGGSVSGVGKPAGDRGLGGALGPQVSGVPQR